MKATTRKNACMVALGVTAIGFALSPTARAVTPPPGGGYPGNNTAAGTDALLNLTTGIHNTAIGAGALRANLTGNFNTAIGPVALGFNTTGRGNTATGNNALFSNTTGTQNTATGFAALFRNTTGSFNTANGRETLHDAPETSPVESPQGGRPKSESDADEPSSNTTEVGRLAPPTPPAGPPPIKPN